MKEEEKKKAPLQFQKSVFSLKKFHLHLGFFFFPLITATNVEYLAVIVSHANLLLILTTHRRISERKALSL